MYNLIIAFRISASYIALALQLASINKHLKGNYNIKIAVIGKPTDLPDDAKAYLKSINENLDVKYLQEINTNEPDTLVAMRAYADTHLAIVFSSSVIIASDMDISLFGTQNFHAIPSNGLGTLEIDQNLWQTLYKQTGTQSHGMCIATRISRQIAPPIFEVDIVVTHNSEALSKTWLKMHTAAINNPTLKSKPRMAWKFSLGLTAMKLSEKYAVIAEECSYPLELKPLANGKAPLAFIYQSIKTLSSEPIVRKLINHLALHDKPLELLLNKNKEWAAVFKDAPKITDELSNDNNIIADGALTGIPRSGTSYLTALLNRSKRVVVINEPVEVNPPLASEIIPLSVARYYRDIKRRIDYKDPIENRIKNGVHIEDTLKENQIELYLPELESSDYSLFTKSTLPYLVRIKELKRAIPGLIMVANIRNPYDTIASWASSFDHLKNASVDNMLVGHPGDPFLPGVQKGYLSLINQTSELAVRRAIYWRYLAETMLNYQHDLIIIRYEDLVAHPKKSIERILHATGMKELNLDPADYPASQARSKSNALSDKDKLAIHLLCDDIAVEFGYTDNDLYKQFQ